MTPPVLHRFSFAPSGLEFILIRSQGGARFTSLALGYFLSGFQPFQFEPPHVGCYWLTDYRSDNR